MIFSENTKPELAEFRRLMAAMDRALNADAAVRESYYQGRSGNPLEDDVLSAVRDCAKGTSFEGTIHKVSGQRFPDIVAKRYYGIEVKSTKNNHWTSTGSSILESTRVKDVQRIFLTFGKLGTPVQFLSRPYEECLSDIAVTHMPRYLIDMRLKTGETIFDKMGIPYDELRNMENPVPPVSRYYKSKLKPGESLWWAGDNSEVTAPMTVRLWTTLSPQEKEQLTVQGYVLFPEVLSKGNSRKYNRYSLWLASQKGIVNTNVRDGFSAGGRVEMEATKGRRFSMPAAFGRIKKYKDSIIQMLQTTPEEELEEYWGVKVDSDRLSQWCYLVCDHALGSATLIESASVLQYIFPSVVIV